MKKTMIYMTLCISASLFISCATTMKPKMQLDDLGSGDTIIYGAITGVEYAVPRVTLTYTSNMDPSGTKVECETYYSRDPVTKKINTVYFAQVVNGFKVLFRSVDLYYSQVNEYYEDRILALPPKYEGMPGDKDETLRSLGVTLKRVADESQLVYVGTLDATHIKSLKEESDNSDVAVEMLDQKAETDQFFKSRFPRIDFSKSVNHKLDVMKNTYNEVNEGLKGAGARSDELLDILMEQSNK